MRSALFYKVSKGKIKISQEEFMQELSSKGIDIGDIRISKEVEIVKKLKEIDITTFKSLLDNELLFRVFSDDLVIPEWGDFTKKIKEIFEECRDISNGTKINSKNKRTDGDSFCISICTIDGQRIDFGDTEVEFCCYSISKVLSYLMAVKEHGSDYVHSLVGKESCDKSYAQLTLKKIKINSNKIKYLPHNPFSSAGALLCSSIVGKNMSEPNRFLEIKNILKKASSSKKINFNQENFLTERNNSDRLRCMAYMMRERKCFPEKISVSELLELYFQLRSLELNSKQMAVFAATLANGGVCPLTGELVFEIENVRDCLSIMLSCGLYDFSGEWAFEIGLPAKSAISGCIIIAVPNRMGICIYSPKVDKIGNSVKATRFAQLLVEHFSFHHLDNMRSQNKDERSQPCLPNINNILTRSESSSSLSTLMHAANEGDLNMIRGLFSESTDFLQKDYDHRTALHLAASKGNTELVSFLVMNEQFELRDWKQLSQRDRWGLTPLDIAEKMSHTQVAKILISRGAKRGSELPPE